MVIKSIIRRFGRVLHLPMRQKMQIIAQYPLTMQRLILERLCQRIFRFPQRCRSRGLVRVDPKVIRQLFRCVIAAQVEQLCHKVDHIAVGSAPEAVEVILIQLHTGCTVGVEGAADHVATVYFQSVVFGSLFHGNCHLDLCK